MRNANIEDVMCANSPACYTPTDVMFLVDHPTFGKHKAHIKGEYYESEVGFVMEDVHGNLMCVSKGWLRPVPRKLGTPAKPKRTPKKGTKPWLGQGVPYDPALIKVGVKVVCRDGCVRHVVRIVDKLVCFTVSSRDVYMFNGKVDGDEREHQLDIIRILVDKPKEDKFNGYAPNVWHFWQGEASSPAIGGDVVVQYWLRRDTMPFVYNQRVACLTWKWQNSPYDIVAFKIIE